MEKKRVQQFGAPEYLGVGNALTILVHRSLELMDTATIVSACSASNTTVDILSLTASDIPYKSTKAVTRRSDLFAAAQSGWLGKCQSVISVSSLESCAILWELGRYLTVHMQEDPLIAGFKSAGKTRLCDSGCWTL